MTSSSNASTVLPFVWWYAGQESFTLAQCTQVSFSLAANNQSSVQPTPPYTMIVYPRMGIPQAIPAGNGTTAFEWRVSYATGTQFLISFVDSLGNSGGTGPLTTVISSTANSCILPSTTPSLNLTLNPNSNPNTCQDMQVSASGGVPPYTLSVQKAADQGDNITGIAEETTYVNKLQAGGTMIFALSDSTGAYAETTDVIFSQGGTNTSCFMNNAPLQSSKKAGLSKGVIGGVAIACLLGTAILIGLGYLWRRRTKNQLRSPTGSIRQSFMRTGQGHQQFLSISPNAKLGADSSPFPTKFAADAASVHSLQALHPVRFRVVNPDEISGEDTSSASISPSRQSFSSQKGAQWEAAATSHSHNRMSSSNSLGGATPRAAHRLSSGHFSPVQTQEPWLDQVGDDYYAQDPFQDAEHEVRSSPPRRYYPGV